MFKFLSMQKYEKSTVGRSRKSKEIYALRHITANNHAETEDIRCCCFHQGYKFNRVLISLPNVF